MSQAPGSSPGLVHMVVTRVSETKAECVMAQNWYTAMADASYWPKQVTRSAQVQGVGKETPLLQGRITRSWTQGGDTFWTTFATYHIYFYKRGTNNMLCSHCNVAQTLLSYLSIHVYLLSHFSLVQLFATLWTAAHQAPMFMGFSRQEYWSGLSCSPPGDLPDQGIKPGSPVAPELLADFLPLSHWGSPLYTYISL